MNQDQKDFIDKAVVIAMHSFREKFDFSREQDYKDCCAMAFQLALALSAERDERYKETT